jgi:bis(5'-nucleosyl)-tetraphosphatase (symmetrical)
MATYAIGDVQGCFDTLQALLERVGFDPVRDRAILVGDLVNRGPGSQAALRWAVAHEDRVELILGNHELHLIARHLDVAQRKQRDTIDDILGAGDADEVVAWLRRRRLALALDGWLFVHAGLLPEWSFADALGLAREVEDALRGDEAAALLAAARSHNGIAWSGSLSGVARLVAVVQALTQLRTIAADGRPCLEFKGSPQEAPHGCEPWFDVPAPWMDEGTVVFGHWAKLGLKITEHAIGLDTGAAWGGALTALRLEDRELFTQPAVERAAVVAEPRSVDRAGDEARRFDPLSALRSRRRRGRRSSSPPPRP